eukprot:gene10685-7608_t
MSLASVQYTSTSYLVGACLILVGIIFPIAQVMLKSRRPVFRSFRRD